MEVINEWGFKNEETKKIIEMRLAKDKKRQQGLKKLTAAEKYALLMKATHRMG